MPPKKVAEASPDEADPQEEEEQEPAEPEILKMCFRVGSQLYSGDCKAGYRDKKGTYLRHGSGRQINAAVIPAGLAVGNGFSYETIVSGYYDGNWDNDVMHGQGLYKWSDGSSYEGAFNRGQMHGNGRFVFPDGSAYEGMWQYGTMHGQGRLDSRFDGRFQQGKFHRNCLQKQDGRWLNVLEQMRSEERQAISDGHPDGLAVRRCAVGDIGASEQQRKSLGAMIAAIHNEGLVPLVMAEESIAGSCSSLECLETAKLLESASHCVSLRLASIAKRRKRDYRRYFYNALQSSLQQGAVCALVFEDDTDGCSEAMSQNAAEDVWFSRRPDARMGVSPMPKEWRLSNYFDPSVLPLEVFAPTLFNGRNMHKLFLSEATLQTSGAPSLPGEPQADATGDDEERVPADVSSASQAMAAAAAAQAPAGTIGLTGHIFECSNGAPQNHGLSQAYCLRPVVVSLGYVPVDLNNGAVRKLAAERMQQHIPLHRTVVLLLGRRGDDDADGGS